MISFVIPTLNEEKILAATLATLRRLDNVDYEIIVSDGHSTDRTAEIAKRYADKVIIHDGKVRQNISGGRNAGAAEAKGDFIVFLDADVTIPNINKFFDVAVGLFTDSSLVGLTVFLKVLPEHITLSDRLFFWIINHVYQVSNNVFHLGAASGEFQMVRADAFRKTSGYNTKLAVGEDNDFFSRLSKIGKTHVATELYVLHTSRRAHNIGWPSLLSLWLINMAYIKVAKRSYNDEWKVIR